jgi:aldose 1-epimerase
VIELRAGAARCVVSADDGGRLASLDVDDTPLLIEASADASERGPMMWGCFPMVPWSGRVRRGQFTFDERQYQLPINFPPHAIHGIAFTRPWDIIEARDSAVTMRCALDDPWPLGGSVEHHIELSADEVACTLTVSAADGAMPVMVGWHPWFVKPAASTIRFARMYQRDSDGIPTGELVVPPPPPWDDCFVGPHAPLVLEYASLSIEIDSDCDHWVVYDAPEHATCVEPQSGPPDAFTLAPRTLGPGETLTRTMTIRWSDTT